MFPQVKGSNRAIFQELVHHMKLTPKPCKTCGDEFTPTAARQPQCEPCRDDSTELVIRERSCRDCGGRFTSAETRCAACIACNPHVDHRIEIPTLAKLSGRRNQELAGFALKLAAKALDKGGRGLSGYASNLVEFANHVSTGTVPNKQWQIYKLGHLISRPAKSSVESGVAA